MSHNLEIKNGKASMMYIGERPWHGLGEYLGENPVPADKAIKAAKMDWKVKLDDVYCQGNKVPNYKAVVREDNGDILSIVGSRYKPFQNEDAFRILDPFIGKNKAVWHTAGVLGKGETIWVLAKLPGNIKVIKDDIVDKYLLLSNSHNGKSPIKLRFTPVRVVCQNTLHSALFGNRDINKINIIKHTQNYNLKIKEALELMGLVQKYEQEFKRVANQMVNFGMTDQEIDDYIADVLDIVGSAKEKVELYKNSRFSKIRDLIETGRGTEIPGVKGTLWGCYNAITESVDHTDRKIKDRIDYMWFASGYEIKERAWIKAKRKVLLRK